MGSWNPLAASFRDNKIHLRYRWWTWFSISLSGKVGRMLPQVMYAIWRTGQFSAVALSTPGEVSRCRLIVTLARRILDSRSREPCRRNQPPVRRLPSGAATSHRTLKQFIRQDAERSWRRRHLISFFGCRVFCPVVPCTS